MILDSRSSILSSVVSLRVEPRLNFTHESNEIEVDDVGAVPPLLSLPTGYVQSFPRRVGNREILPKVYHRTAFGRLSARSGHYRDPVTIELWIAVYSTPMTSQPEVLRTPR